MSRGLPGQHANIFYCLGEITLTRFLVQVATPPVRFCYDLYRPTVTEAFSSVQYRMTEVHFGWLIRSVHRWSASMTVLIFCWGEESIVSLPACMCARLFDAVVPAAFSMRSPYPSCPVLRSFFALCPILLHRFIAGLQQEISDR